MSKRFATTLLLAFSVAGQAMQPMTGAVKPRDNGGEVFRDQTPQP